MSDERSITVELHWPPSVNQTYMPAPSGRGIIKKKAAKQWMKDAWFLLTYQKPAGWRPLTGKLKATVEMTPPDARHSDIDNRFKAIFDAVEKAGIIDNDRQIKRIEADFLDPKKPGFVRLKLESLQPRVRK